jgi:hypothetical protein
MPYCLDMLMPFDDLPAPGAPIKMTNGLAPPGYRFHHTLLGRVRIPWQADDPE